MSSSSLYLAVLVLAVLFQLSVAQSCNLLYFTPNGFTNAAGTSNGGSVSGSSSYIFLNPITLNTSIDVAGISLYPMTLTSDTTTTLSLTAGIYSGNISNLTLLAQAIPLSAQGSFPTSQLLLTPLTSLFSNMFTLPAGNYFIAYWYTWYGGLSNSALTFAFTGDVNTTITDYYVTSVNYTFGVALPATINSSSGAGTLQPGLLAAIVGPLRTCPASSTSSYSSSSSSTGFNAASAMALPSATVLAVLLLAAAISMLMM